MNKLLSILIIIGLIFVFGVAFMQLLISQFLKNTNKLIIYKNEIFAFLLGLFSLIIFILLIIYTNNKYFPNTEIPIINNVLKSLKYVSYFILFGFVFSLILTPYTNIIKNGLLYIKDTFIILLVLSLIILMYNLILLFILE
tara:strand:+ start:268 stop:690 length:423 start_codon:yes stop_codon:yes gene_type:complete